MAKLSPGWVAIPKIGTWVSSSHPRTCLNPDPYFRVKEISISNDKISVRGRDTCWFGLGMISPVPDNTTVRECGFDRTEFKSAEAFQKIMQEFGLQYLGQNRDNNNCFMFGGPKVSMHTTNHPITGEFYQKVGGGPNKGWAALVGITGDYYEVAKLVERVKEQATNIKGGGFDPNWRSYI